jgi:hypothetical protein
MHDWLPKQEPAGGHRVEMNRVVITREPGEGELIVGGEGSGSRCHRSGCQRFNDHAGTEQALP